MPQMVKFCLEPGCTSMVTRSEDSRCRAHERLRHLPYKNPIYRAFVRATSCATCGTTTDLTRDHVRPLARGGGVSANLQTLCRSCNSRKGSS